MSDEHYFTADPSVPFQRVPVRVDVWGHWLEMTTGSGVFARGRLDIGTSVLLRALRKIEADLGRPGHHERNVSRTLDLDLLYAGNRVINDEELQLPHPRMTTRRFVLAPLADIQPDLILPGHSHTVAELLQTLSAEPAVLRVAERW